MKKTATTPIAITLLDVILAALTAKVAASKLKGSRVATVEEPDMIECMQDSQWPERVRVSIRGLDLWLNMEEADRLWKQLGYVLANPILPVDRPIKVFQLYEAKK